MSGEYMSNTKENLNKIEKIEKELEKIQDLMDEYENKKSKNCAYLLYLFLLGPFGAHDFYLKKFIAGGTKFLLCMIKFISPLDIGIGIFVGLIVWCGIDFYKNKERVSESNLKLLEEICQNHNIKIIN